MRSARHILRRFAAILRVAALLVMIPAFAQAHAGHAHASHPAVGHVSKAAAQAVPAMQAGLVAVMAVTDTASDRAECLACPGCCCAHVFVASPDSDAGQADRPSGRRVAMGPDFARPSAGPEGLPEPPRPFA